MMAWVSPRSRFTRPTTENCSSCRCFPNRLVLYDACEAHKATSSCGAVFWVSFPSTWELLDKKTLSIHQSASDYASSCSGIDDTRARFVSTLSASVIRYDVGTEWHVSPVTAFRSYYSYWFSVPYLSTSSYACCCRFELKLWLCVRFDEGCSEANEKECVPSSGLLIYRFEEEHNNMPWK